MEGDLPGGCQKFEKGYGKSDVEFEKSQYSGRRTDTHGLVDASTWTNDVCASEFSACDLEHALKVSPVTDVCLLENSFGGGVRSVGMDRYKLLSFGAEG